MKKAEEELAVKEEKLDALKQELFAAGISVQLFQADRDSGRNRCAGGRNHGGYGKLGGTFPAA